MKKLAVFIIGLVLMSALPGALFVEAQTADIQSKIDDVSRQRDALLQQQRQLQAQLDALGSQSKTLQGNLKTLDAARRKLLNDIRITQTNINAADLQIQALDQSISQNEQAIGAHEAAIAASVRQLEVYDGHSLAYDVLSYPSIAEVWSDQSNLAQVEDNLTQAIEGLKASEVALTQNKASKEAQKNNLVSYQSQLAGQKQVVDSTTKAKSALLAATKDQESQYQKLLADNLAREKQFEDLLFQYQSQLKAASGAAPAAHHGFLPSFPLTSIRVTQPFGRTAFSVRLYASGTHSGTDFAASVGTPVMAAADGVVGGLGNTDDAKGCYSYGRWLFINYDVGVSSIYGHLSSIIVSPGQAVKAGQVVAYSGGQPGVYGSGYATGPHLHMGLFNSAGVSIQPYTSSIGCKNVSIPLANPKDYLDPMAYLPAL